MRLLPPNRSPPKQKREALVRAFQVNDNFLHRWPRFAELQSEMRSAGAEACVAYWSPREWRDLQLLSQLAWMDEEYLAKDPGVARLSAKGKYFTEDDKRVLFDRQQELLAAVLPEYRLAAARGQIEISTTPYYHPILPLLCDTDIARVANPQTPLPNPAFRYPQDALEQTRQVGENSMSASLARRRRAFGPRRAPSRTSRWILGWTWASNGLQPMRECWDARSTSASGAMRAVIPKTDRDLLHPLAFAARRKKQMSGFFRDHYLSDLVGFVYSRMDAESAAEDLHRRIRAIGDREPPGRNATVSLILDGENAWEYYPGNGRDFLRSFYRRIEQDPDISALTVSEAIQAVPEQPRLEGIFPASWISGNFDVWIGDAEDVRAWDLLRDARDVFERAIQRAHATRSLKSEEWIANNTASALTNRFSRPRAAIGAGGTVPNMDRQTMRNSTNCTASTSPGRFIVRAWRTGARCARPPLFAARRTRGRRQDPGGYLDVKVDGRESSYFEWLGSGVYSTDRRSSAMHGRTYALGDFHYGFSSRHFFLRVDPIPEAIEKFLDFQVRLTLWDSRETRITLHVEQGKITGCILEQSGVCLLRPEKIVSSAYGKILEVGLPRELFDLTGRNEILISVALLVGGFPVDVLPGEGMVAFDLGEENFAWPAEMS